MTGFTLLILCILAQILIAGALGIYLYRHFRRQGKEKKTKDPSGPASFENPE